MKEREREREKEREREGEGGRGREREGERERAGSGRRRASRASCAASGSADAADADAAAGAGDQQLPGAASPCKAESTASCVSASAPPPPPPPPPPSSSSPPDCRSTTTHAWKCTCAFTRARACPGASACALSQPRRCLPQQPRECVRWRHDVEQPLAHLAATRAPPPSPTPCASHGSRASRHRSGLAREAGLRLWDGRHGNGSARHPV